MKSERSKIIIANIEIALVIMLVSSLIIIITEDNGIIKDECDKVASALEKSHNNLAYQNVFVPKQDQVSYRDVLIYNQKCR